MLCPSTPAAPSLARTFAQAAASVAGAHTLSIRLIPTSSFDAVHQRRHHALRPDRGFHPRPVAGFCTLCSPRGHCRRCSCFVPVLHASTFLPPFPRRGFAPRAFRGFRRCGTMRALTPAGLAHTRQVSPLTPLCLPDIPPPTTCARPDVAFPVTSARPVGASRGSRLRHCTRRLAATPRRIGFVILQAVRSPPVAPHPASRRRSYLRLHVAVTPHGTDFHLADKASSRTHDRRLPARPHEV